MKRVTNFARATASVCGAFFLMEPAETQADPFKIRELRIVDVSRDIRSDPSIAFNEDSQKAYVAWLESEQAETQCKIAEYDLEFAFQNLWRTIAAGPFANTQIGVTSNGHSAVRVGSNGNFVAHELVPSPVDPAKLDLIVRSAVFANMSDRLEIADNGRIVFAAGAGAFGSFLSIQVSAPGATTSTPIIDNSGPFDTFFAPAGNAIARRLLLTAYKDDNTGGFWSLENNGVATPVVTTNDGYGAFGGGSINDQGTPAFRAIKNSGTEMIGRFRNNQVEELMNTAGSFFSFTDPSINNRDEVVAGATNDDFSKGVFFSQSYTLFPPPPPAAESLSALPSPTPITVIKTGDALSGSTVTEVSVGSEALTDRGEIIFRATLADGREGIYLATPKRSALLNIATRLRVLTGENVLIAGFIVTGADPKKVIIRGIGPSLGGAGVQGALADPVLELHQGNATLATNNNWKIKDADGTSQEAEIEATTIPPSNDKEAALVATLQPGAYTAILSGTSNGTGIGLVEVYDLDQTANAQAVNISTRGFVDTGDNVMIGGLIAGPPDAVSSRILIRALGPSLQSSGVAGALANPLLELHDASGATLATNDDWKINSADGSSQQAEIEATTIPPTNDLESAILASLPPGTYTAVVRGTAGTSGVGLVEFYNLK